ncbi:MAG: hypothetical protein MZW92_71865 [Comamonadaceae bacterium]|nr:hypothetical protein [Comamonadaceae bacterium]
MFYHLQSGNTSDSFWTDRADAHYKKEFVKHTLEPRRAARKIVKENFLNTPKEELIRKIYDYVISNYTPVDTLSPNEREEHKRELRGMYWYSDPGRFLKRKIVYGSQMIEILANLILTAAPDAVVEPVNYLPWNQNLLIRESRTWDSSLPACFG